MCWLLCVFIFRLAVLRSWSWIVGVFGSGVWEREGGGESGWCVLWLAGRVFSVAVLDGWPWGLVDYTGYRVEEYVRSLCFESPWSNGRSVKRWNRGGRGV